MLKIVELFGSVPESYLVDTASHFQPGHFASLKIKNGELVAGISDGLNPIGVLDDIRSNYIRKIVISELVTLICNPFDIMFSTKHSAFVTKCPIKIELKHNNIVENSFICYEEGFKLDAKAGLLLIQEGTVCNVTTSNETSISHFVDKGTRNAFRLYCSYAYNVLSDRMDDSTKNSNRVTVWNKTIIAYTDMYDISQTYEKNVPLYVENGLLTSRKPTPHSKCIGMSLEEPTHDQPNLKFLLDLEGKFGISK